MTLRPWTAAAILIACVTAAGIAFTMMRSVDRDVTGAVDNTRPGDEVQSAARLQPVAFSALPGWRKDDAAEALLAFNRSCRQLAKARGAWPGWSALCARAMAAGGSSAAARDFFEANFVPHRIRLEQDRRGFLTSYYEPEVAGALFRDARFNVPIYARPDDLVTLKQGQNRRGLPPSFSAGRRVGEALQPYFSRAEIDQGALAGRGLELLYLNDPVEAFFIHVQGSARVRLDNGSVIRLAFAAKNGHPYTSIARVLIRDENIPKEEMTADRLRAWLNAHPERAHEIMWHNDSFIFFRKVSIADETLGPIGAQGVNLTPGRSLAVDLAYHGLGLPFFIDASLPDGDGALAPFRRLMIAQDTGSAILGAARGDIFWGSGDEAGFRAGLVRHPGDFYLLLPAGYPTPAWARRSGS